MYQTIKAAVRAAAMLASFIALTAQAFAQECPHESATGAGTASKVRTLEGQLIFHNGIRGWFELKLDKATCEHTSLQLLQFKEENRDLTVLRGCRVKSSGSIDFSTTGYYSADLFQDVEKVEPVGKCVKQPPFADYSNAKPDRRINAYTVDMQLDYSPGDHPIAFHVRSGGRDLRPWQAYAHYMLTGGFVLYGYCAEGFVVDKVYGPPAANLGHSDDPGTPDDAASYSAEGPAVAGKTDLHLGYTCIRNEKRSEGP